MKDQIANQLVKYLEARGVEHIFGLCGHTNIAVLAALSKSKKIKFVNTRHEQIAAHAADGYARATKKASVVLSHLSPGLTNAATGVANAALDSIPMVVIAGDVPSHYYGKHPHQEVNLHADASQYEIYRPFVKRAWRVDSPHLFPEIIEKAFTLAESGRPGPVLVDVPMDIFSQEIDVKLWERLRHNAKTLAKPSLDDETATRIVKQLLAAKTPLLYVGGGILLADAAAEMREFAEHLSLPVAHTLMGKGALPDDHPLILGMTGFWGTKFINDKCKGADWILALGTRFSEADCSSWEDEYTFNFPPTKLIHIDIDPAEIGRNYPVAIGAVADLKEALAVLTRVAREARARRACKRAALVAEMAANRKRFVAGNRKAHATSDAYPMRPERILADVRAALPRDALITTDVGWNKNGVGQQFPILEPGTIFTPGGYATMGFGAPAALGAKIARPDRVVVALVGDGGFGQNPAMLATAFEQDVAVVWVIMNNMAFGTIAGLEKAHYGTTFGTVFEKDGKPYSPDYAAIAKAYGIDGVKIHKAAEFRPALEKAIKSKKPFVIDVVMQNEPVPTAGHWNIMDIYSPGKKVHHVSTGRPGARRLTIDASGRGRPMRHEYSLAHLTVLSLTPPQLVEVAARTGYEYVGVRITRVTPAGGALRSRARPRAHAGDQGAARRHGHRGPRRRAVPDGPVARARALRAGARRDRRARRAAHHRPAAGPGSRARDRALRAALRPRAAARHLREPRVPALDRDGDAVGGGARRARGQPAQRGDPGRHAAFRTLAFEPGRAREAAARVVPLRARLRRGDRGPADDGGHHPHGARRTAVPGRGRHSRPRDPRADAAGHSVRARDPAGGADQSRRTRRGRAACRRRREEPSRRFGAGPPRRRRCACRHRGSRRRSLIDATSQGDSA